MEVDEDFEKLLLGYSVVTITVFYYIPERRSLLNEFMWQTLDLRPKYPRIERFLCFWHKEIDAVVQEICLADSLGLAPRRFRHIEDFTGVLN